MKPWLTSIFIGLLMALTSCAVPHGWKVTHEDVAVRRDSSGAVIERIDCETHFTHQFYLTSPEGLAADKWCEHERYFYLVHSDNSRTPLSCIPNYSNPRFFPLRDSQWLAIWPNEGYAPAYSQNLAVALLDTKNTRHKANIPGYYYLAKSSVAGNVLTPTGRPFENNIQAADLNYKVDVENGNAVIKTYYGDFIFDFSDGTLKPR